MQFERGWSRFWVLVRALLAAAALVGCSSPNKENKAPADFAGLARYREENSMLAPPADNERRVVLIGDSITENWKLDEYFPDRPFINRGISSQTTSQVLLRFRADVIDLKPKVVVILAGTNDIAGHTGPVPLEAVEANIASMADLARANGIAVVLASILPVRDYARILNTPERPPAQIVALNNWIKSYCAGKEIVYLDYFAAMIDENGSLKEDFTSDGLHPNAKGYEAMKVLAGPAIDKALKKQ